MHEVIDYTKLTPKKFWDLVTKQNDESEERFKQLWERANEHILTQEEAILCLNDLFIYSHHRIREHSKALAKHYPTKQCNRNRLTNVDHLYWLDHFTAGISRWSTLNWFSSAKRKKKSGRMGYAGASTHFVQGYHDHPFYIIPLMHGSWNEPRRNKDSISIEMVNSGLLKRKGNDWHYWARKLPLALVQELPPVLLDKPYRGIKVMQPFTPEQFTNNIVLKRIIIAAMPDRLDSCRMSQHSDWRQGKTDMGPLWLYDECNEAAFAPDPIPELEFLQQQEYTEFLDDEGAIWDEEDGWEEHDDTDNPEYGEETPTHDDDPDDDDDEVLDTQDIQQLLQRKGYQLKDDGIPGPKTRSCIVQFQRDWNKKNPRDMIKADGIPGPQTCERLKK